MYSHMTCILVMGRHHVNQIRQMKKGDRKDKIAVVVGTITNDVRILDVPKLKVIVALLAREPVSLRRSV